MADQGSLAKVDRGPLAMPHATLSIGALEHALLKAFPQEWAESWDRTGLLVGDPAQTVQGVAIALDVTPDAIGQAKAAGANVLLTHHPAFLSTDGRVRPDLALDVSGGRIVWDAITKGIALMNFHTALDVSPQAATVLPGLLRLQYLHPLVYAPQTPGYGYGQVCAVPEEEGIASVRQLAARCVSVFEREPRVWGAADREVKRVATWTGSVGGMVSAATARDIDCLICGEIKYHEALALAGEGLAIIELGHDVSELPLTLPLSQAAIQAGVDESRIVLLDQSGNWYTPQNTRL